jgi:hypothetical protein
MNKAWGFLQYFALLTWLLFVCSCTTIKPHSERLKLASEPEGAEVYLDGKLLGHTPGWIAVPRNKSATLEFKKKGYPTIYK